MELIRFFINNFWIIFLICVFLSNERFFISGILLLVTLVFTKGDLPQWLLIVITLISIFTTYLNPRKFYKLRYERKVEELEKKYEPKKFVVRDLDKE